MKETHSPSPNLQIHHPDFLHRHPPEETSFPMLPETSQWWQVLLMACVGVSFSSSFSSWERSSPSNRQLWEDLMVVATLLLLLPKSRRRQQGTARGANDIGAAPSWCTPDCGEWIGVSTWILESHLRSSAFQSLPRGVESMQERVEPTTSTQNLTHSPTHQCTATLKSF